MGGLPGYDAVIQAMCGMFSINGMPHADGSGGPTRIGIPLVDLGTGLYAAIALLMALVERARSGQGQFIDMTLYDAGIALMHPHIPNYLLSGRLPGLTGNPSNVKDGLILRWMRGSSPRMTAPFFASSTTSSPAHAAAPRGRRAPPRRSA